MKTLREQHQRIVQEYMRETGKDAIVPQEVAAWAIDRGLWQPHASAFVRQCSEQIARALREEFFIDANGRKVRAKHVVVSGIRGKQIPLWADMRTASREHMAVAFQQRRRQIVGDCCQLKSDVDSYNEFLSSDDPIQMEFNFTNDVEEADLVRCDRRLAGTPRFTTVRSADAA